MLEIPFQLYIYKTKDRYKIVDMDFRSKDITFMDNNGRIEIVTFHRRYHRFVNYIGQDTIFQPIYEFDIIKYITDGDINYKRIEYSEREMSYRLRPIEGWEDDPPYFDDIPSPMCIGSYKNYMRIVKGN
jgi:hypothetical protein